MVGLDLTTTCLPLTIDIKPAAPTRGEGPLRPEAKGFLVGRPSDAVEEEKVKVIPASVDLPNGAATTSRAWPDSTDWDTHPPF